MQDLCSGITITYTPLRSRPKETCLLVALTMKLSSSGMYGQQESCALCRHIPILLAEWTSSAMEHL